MPSVPLFTGMWVRAGRKESFSKAHEAMAVLKDYEEVDASLLKDDKEEGEEY